MADLTKRLQQLQKKAHEVTEQYKKPAVCRALCTVVASELMWVLVHAEEPGHKDQALAFLQDLTELEGIEDMEMLAATLLSDYFCPLRAYAMHSRTEYKEVMQAHAIYKCEDVDAACCTVLGTTYTTKKIPTLPPRPERVSRIAQLRRIRLVADNTSPSG